MSGCASATMRYLALAWAAAHALQHPGARRRRATPCAALSAADEFVVKVGVVDALRGRRPQRFVGTTYLPDNELRSHYIDADVPSP